MNEDEKFDDSMIPLKKFSEYEAEACDMGSGLSEDTHRTGQSGKPRSRLPPSQSRPESSRSHHQNSQSGDYYKDTNLTYNNSSNPNLRLGGSQVSHNIPYQASPRALPFMSQYGPQLPLMPFSGGPGSYVSSSDHGHGSQFAVPGPQMSYPQTASMYGPMSSGLRNTVVSDMGPFGIGSGASQSVQSLHGAPPLDTVIAPRPMSTFSLATTVGPMAVPSFNPNPSDDELFNALRTYLSTQDLMTVSKKTTREAIMAKFPKADLTGRKEFLNKSIDTLLSPP
jgi:chitin synthase